MRQKISTYIAIAIGGISIIVSIIFALVQSQG
jgi:hypothetical protein